MNTSSLPSDPRPGSQIGGWEVVSIAGRGGMATVYGAQDPRTGELRALKLMHGGAGNEEVARRFLREYRTLSRLRHPNLTRVYDAGSWEGRPWFVMDLVEGQDLRAIVEGWGESLPASRLTLLRDVARQVASALAYVHARGLVHRDITPSNIRVLPDGTVRVMDFGVVKEQGSTELTSHGELLGTVAYVAPEQISGGTVDARTDLYALGAVLYFGLTGRRPFNARTLAGYLDKHLHSTVRPLSELAPDVPADLEHVCLRLLSKDPRERYASATHLLSALSGPGPLDVSRDDWPRALAGRAEAVSTIHAALAACREGIGGVLVIEGPGGSGKTRLARHLRATARESGLSALLARALPTGDPLHAYARVYAALRADGLPAAPLLDRLFGPDADAQVHERYALFNAFREMTVGTAPRVIAVDDLHFADPGSVDLLEFLVRTTVALAHAPILWVFTRTPGVADARTDGLFTGARSEVPPTVVTLAPLAGPDIEELVADIVPDGPSADALAARVLRETEGNAAYVVEMLRALVAEGIVVEDAEGRCVTRSADELASGPMPLPRTLRAQLLGRLDELPAAARAVAEALAVARQELPIATVAAIARLDETDAIEAIDALAARGLVRERHDEGAGTVELAQPRTRELLYAEIPPIARVELHRRVGEAIERAYRRRLHHVYEPLAYHFERGGLPAKAFPYFMNAGIRLLDRSFAAEALRAFDRGLALEEDAREVIPLEDADRQLCQTLLRRSEALDHLGRSNDTRADLERARQMAADLDNSALGARAEASLGLLARQCGDLDAAEAHFKRSLQFADRAGESSLHAVPLNGLASVHWARGDLEGAHHWWGLAVKKGDDANDDRCRAFGHNGLGLVALGRGQTAEARRCFEQSAEVFERVPMLGPLATARVNLVEIHHFTGNFKRGLELAERTIAQARETRHLLGIARGRHHKALLLVDLGRYTQAREEAAEALSIVRSLQHAEDELATLAGRLRADWALDDRASVRAGLQEAEALLEGYDPEGFAPIVFTWKARLAALDGDITRAHAELARALEWPGSRWPYQECRLDLAVARVYAVLGNAAEATRRAEAAVRRADACGLRFYGLKGHRMAALHSTDEAAVARHRRVADALARSLAANLAREDAERFLSLEAPTH